MARSLALSWASFVGALLLVTSWLVGDPHPVDATSAPPPRASALPFTPGFGWFEGRVTRALVDGFDFGQGFNGPLIIETASRQRYGARIAVTGRDRRTSVVPMLFMHRVADTMPVLMIAQRGAHVTVRGDSRAGRLGFAVPELVLRLQRPFNSLRPAAQEVLISARVSPRALALTVDDASSHESVQMLRTPTVAWAFMQSLVPLGADHAATVTRLWLVALFLPFGFWGWLSARHRGYVVVVGALLVSAALFASVHMFAVACPPPIELGGMLVGVFVGFAAARISIAGNR